MTKHDARDATHTIKRLNVLLKQEDGMWYEWDWVSGKWFVSQLDLSEAEQL